MPRDLTRITLNLVPESVKALDQVTARTGHNNTDAINIAVRLMAKIVTGELELCRRDGDTLTPVIINL